MRGRDLRFWAGFPSFQDVPIHRYAHSFHGRRDDHLFLSRCHTEFAKVSGGYTHPDSDFACVHRHRDNDRVLGILREPDGPLLWVSDGPRIGRHAR